MPDNLIPLSPDEKARISLLVTAREIFTRNRLRALLLGQGYASVTEAADQKGALQRLGERSFTHIIFSLEDTQIPAEDFARRVRNLDSKTVLIALHRGAEGDVMFSLLQNGVRGFMVYPLTAENVEAAMAQATHGKPVPDAVLQASDRNRALSNMVAASLDEAAEAVREFGYESRREGELCSALQSFRRTVRVARTFAAGGLHNLLENMQQFFIDRAPQPLTHLGKLRRRLKTHRDVKYGRREKP